MNATPVAILWCLIMLALCILAAWWDRPKRNHRFRTLPPPSFKDDRDSIQSHRRMYGK